MKKVLVFAMGGTIACTFDNSTGGLKPTLSGEELTGSVPALNDLCSIETIEVSSEPSSRITPEKMLELSNLIDEKLLDDNVLGAVVTHGTDTLEETAYFLDITLQSKKPVCVTGAMRSSSEISPDGAINMVASVKAVLSGELNNMGVFVVMNEFIHYAEYAVKTHSGNAASFSSGFWGTAGYIDNDRVILKARKNRSHIFKPLRANLNVPVVKLYTGMEADIFDYYLSKKIDGIVIEAFGRGNFSDKLVTAVEKLIKSGIPVILSTRTFGRVLDVYSYEGGAGHTVNLGIIIPEDELSSAKLRLKLIAALGSGIKQGDIKNIF